MTNEQTDCDVVIVQQAEARASAELMAADAQLAWRQDLKITAERELAAARRHSETAKIKWRSLADATAAAKAQARKLTAPTDPCPWCQHASPYLTDADNPMIQITCEKCGACGPLMANETAAVEAWNRIGNDTERPNAT